eukprot:UN21355
MKNIRCLKLPSTNSHNLIILTKGCTKLRRLHILQNTHLSDKSKEMLMKLKDFELFSLP